MELTLGPVYYNWDREEIIKFYDEAANWPVDRVYIGEVVCSKRSGLSLQDLENIGQRLIDRGKKVVLSTLALVSNEEELTHVREITDLPFPIEANDMSVFNMANSKEIIAGPHINVYDHLSAEFLKCQGIKRVVFPIELSGRSIRHILSRVDLEGEIIAYGKLPVAYSWRCYTLRDIGLGRAECQNNCNDHPEGIPVDTMDRQPIFTINGPQILSGPVCSLLEHLNDMKETGLKALRISPQYRDTEKIVKLFRNSIEGGFIAEAAIILLKETADPPFCNGWFLGKAGLEYVQEK